jgi:RluA family pseudouridine synthase
MEGSITSHPVGRDAHRLRLDRFLLKARPDLGRRAIARLLRAGAVTIDGRPYDERRFVKHGETVEVHLVQVPSAGPPRVILRTEHMIAIGKPPGMPTNPSPATSDSLLAWVEKTVAPARPGIVHRLDRDTSGLVLFSLSPEGHRILDQSFRGHLIRKLYLALVVGRIHPRRGVIDRPLERDRSGRMRVDPLGRPARTEYATLKALATCSLLSVLPRTGRMHQIRIHLASLGHPIAADPDYGDPRHTLGAPRLWLHAAEIDFPPGIAEALGAPPKLECSLWEDLEGHLARIGLIYGVEPTQGIEPT